MRPAPSAQTASICGSCLGSSEPESFAMLLVCQSIWPPSLRDRENHAIFATRSPTAIKNIWPFRLRRKQIPDTSRSGTCTTRRTRSRLLFGLPFLAMGEGAQHSASRYLERQTPLCSGQDRVGPKSNVRFGSKAEVKTLHFDICFTPESDVGCVFLGHPLWGQCGHRAGS